jgi:hypothetical protein
MAAIQPPSIRVTSDQFGPKTCDGLSGLSGRADAVNLLRAMFDNLDGLDPDTDDGDEE